MSEKRFSTDEIIEALKGVMSALYSERAWEAIARLKAADALCEAAKEEWALTHVYKLGKAIKEYEAAT